MEIRKYEGGIHPWLSTGLKKLIRVSPSKVSEVVPKFCTTRFRRVQVEGSTHLTTRLLPYDELCASLKNSCSGERRIVGNNVNER